jgi:hypothetical protein
LFRDGGSSHGGALPEARRYREVNAVKRPIGMRLQLIPAFIEAIDRFEKSARVRRVNGNRNSQLPGDIKLTITSRFAASIVGKEEVLDTVTESNARMAYHATTVYGLFAHAIDTRASLLLIDVFRSNVRRLRHRYG